MALPLFPIQKPRLGPKKTWAKEAEAFATVRLDCREIRMKYSTASNFVALTRIMTSNFISLSRNQGHSHTDGAPPEINNMRQSH